MSHKLTNCTHIPRKPQDCEVDVNGPVIKIHMSHEMHRSHELILSYERTIHAHIPREPRDFEVDVAEPAIEVGAVVLLYRPVQCQMRRVIATNHGGLLVT